MSYQFHPSALLVTAPLFFILCAPVHAASIDETLPDATALTQLELRAQQANPRDQCFLYTQLVHTMTEMVVKQFANGDDDSAAATLKQINHYAQLIQSNLAKNTKRLKNAEMLMDHSTVRLAQALHLTSDKDRVSVQATLKQLNLVQNQLLDQVFNH
ncbi:MAG: hypothetical protein ABI072_01325 [Edaphobacter sp.]